IAGSFVGHEVSGRHFDARRTDAGDSFGYIAHPRAPSDVVVKPRIAVDEDVDAGAMLSRHVTREAIEMLLAIGEAGKTLREGNAAQILGVPARAGQRPRGRSEKSFAFCRSKHATSPHFTNGKPRCAHGFVQVN